MRLTPVRITDIMLSRTTLGKCRLLLRHFRDVTLTPARITEITLSQMNLGKCRLLQRDVILISARITDITLWQKCLAPAAMLCPGFCTRCLRRRSKRLKRVKHFRTIHTLRSLPDERGDVCKVCFRLVQKCGFVKGTNKQKKKRTKNHFSFIYKIASRR